jgi:serine phosphatase RsbU (regulator of sigma subunit)
LLRAIYHLAGNAINFYFTNDEIIHIKGNKTTIYIKDDLNVHFDEYDFTLEEGDIVCLYSDGMIDQFGGERNKKLNSKGLQKCTLESVAHQNKQEFFDKKLNDWMKNSGQIDDITLMPF